ncbi:MAG: type II secretion system protein GspE [Betaproteobacteria bacterium]|jgi:general secretion pathway protein E|nr:type II secretion system protein GspE [Betaproteobacteria bacterium]
MTIDDSTWVPVSPARFVPYSFARSHRLLVKAEDAGRLLVLQCEASSSAGVNELYRVLDQELVFQRLPQDQLERDIAQAYAKQDGSAAAVVDAVESDLDLSQLMQDVPRVEDLLDAQDDAPIIRMINALLTQAVRDGASDIHIEAFEHFSLVRFRIDGSLRDVARPRRELHAALLSRIKILASLDIAEKRLPQDGRMALRVAGKAVDVRVSTLPTGHGERAVLRLLDKQAGRLDLKALGLADDTRVALSKLVRQPHGIVLVTGPTGSGKTTTLYAALGQLDSTVTNILTVEDPIEYDLEGVGQTQVNARIDMDFARALRAILRQDPDVVMIGEIRDLETAQIAVQASLTGHLVLATLHTNDAIAAVTRLVDMGIEPFLLSSSLLGVLSQRLIRLLCEACKVPDPLHPGAWRAVGCSVCAQSGFRGRAAICELLEVDQAMQGLIHEAASEARMRELAQRNGFKNMREDAQRWLQAGSTSVDEVVRVTRDA